MNATTEAFTRIAELPFHGLSIGEDVKIKIALPLLRALGYGDAITRRQEEMRRKQSRLREIDTAIQDLTAERGRIDEHMQQLRSERALIAKDLGLDPPGNGRRDLPDERDYPASPHILRLLGEQGA